eukprot:m.7147 g.7147  ORF g.7147 m.7147 type:complete len:1672 (+) comp17893_c0_seq1:82-5097(+)
MSVEEFSITQCPDAEFEEALAQFNLPELQAADDIFAKQIDVEQRIQAGLQNLIKLYKSQPTKDSSVNKFMASTKQLVASQGRLATLKSRSLRCVKRKIDIEGTAAVQEEGRLDVNGRPSSTSNKKGLDRYYQGYLPGVRREKGPRAVAPLKLPKPAPAHQRKSPVVQAVQIPRDPTRAPSQATSGSPPTKPRGYHRRVTAHGISLGSVDLTVFINPEQNRPVYARSIPQTFTYIQTESHALPQRESPYYKYKEPDVLHQDGPPPSSLQKQARISTAEVPLLLHPLRSDIHDSVSSTPNPRAGPVRKRASTMPGRGPGSMKKPSATLTLQPLPTQQSQVRIPAPVMKVGPATTDILQSESSASEDEGEVVTSVTIQPHRYISQSEETNEEEDSDGTAGRKTVPPLVFDASFGEVRVHVGGSKAVRSSEGGSGERQKARILIEGEKQADAEIPVVSMVPDEEEAIDAEPNRPPTPMIDDSDDEEPPPPLPERPREDYSVRIRIAKDIPLMVHEPIAPPVMQRNVNAEWDDFDELESLPTSPVEEWDVSEQVVPEIVLHEQSAIEWDDLGNGEDDIVEKEVSPELIIHTELPAHDRVSEPEFVQRSAHDWPDFRSPSPEPLDGVDVVLPEVIHIDLPAENVRPMAISEVDGVLRMPAYEEEEPEDTTFPSNLQLDYPNYVDSPAVDIDWNDLVIISKKPAKPVPVSITLLRIIVSDPQVHPNYIDFKIEFKSCLPCFPWGESVVRRRLQEFVWLRKKLKSPGVYVPPLLGSLDKLSELQEALQHCLRLICSDPMHQYEESLHLFLTSQFPIPDAILISSAQVDEMLVEEAEEIEEEDLSSNDGSVGAVEATEPANWENPFRMHVHGNIELELTALENLRPSSEGVTERGMAGLGPENRLEFGLLPKKKQDDQLGDFVSRTFGTFLEERTAAPPASVEIWLTEMGVPQYIPRFIEYGYDEIWVCAHLDDDDLITLGIINAEHRKLLLLNANLWKYRLNPEDINTQVNKDKDNALDNADQGVDQLDISSPVHSKSPEEPAVVQTVTPVMASKSSSALVLSPDISNEQTVLRSASSSMLSARSPGEGLTHHWLRLTTEHKGIDSDYGVSGLHVRDRGSLAIFGTLPRVHTSHEDSRELGKLDEKREDYMSVKAWDPTPLLTELYSDVHVAPEAVTKPLKYVSMNKTKAGVRAEAYLDKLPLNQRKPSLLHGWKKRYFKATDGNLFYYDGKKSERALGFIKLAGSKITRTTERQIQISDKRGKFMMIRTQSKGEAVDWTAALEAESIIMTSNELHFLNLRAVIVDLGSSSIRAGIAYENAYPQMFFPSAIAIDKRESATRKLGIEALRPDVRDLCKVYYPFKPSSSINKSTAADAQDLIFIFNHVFQHLQVDPRQFKVIVAVSQFMTQKDKEVLMNVLLEQLGAQAVYLQEQSILSMYSYHETTGVVVDIGERVDVVPVDQGFVVGAGVSRLPYGGRALTESLMRLVTQSGHRYFSEVESYITRYLKEKAAFIALNYESTVNAVKTHPQRYTETIATEKFSLPDNAKSISLVTERFDCAEGLFNPCTMLHKDNPGIHELVHKAVQACSIDTRKDLYRNIFLSGGTTKIPGFAERLEREVSALVPSSVLVQVHAHPDRQHAAFAGAAVAAALSTFDEMCVSQDDWLRNGPDSMQKWSLY